jgi:hypothetical protein
VSPTSGTDERRNGEQQGDEGDTQRALVLLAHHDWNLDLTRVKGRTPMSAGMDNNRVTKETHKCCRGCCVPPHCRHTASTGQKKTKRKKKRKHWHTSHLGAIGATIRLGLLRPSQQGNRRRGPRLSRCALLQINLFFALRHGAQPKTIPVWPSRECGQIAVRSVDISTNKDLGATRRSTRFG